MSMYIQRVGVLPKFYIRLTAFLTLLIILFHLARSLLHFEWGYSIRLVRCYFSPSLHLFISRALVSYGAVFGVSYAKSRCLRYLASWGPNECWWLSWGFTAATGTSLKRHRVSFASSLLFSSFRSFSILLGIRSRTMVYEQTLGGINER